MEKTKTKITSTSSWVKQIVFSVFTLFAFILLWSSLKKIFGHPESTEALYSLTFNSFSFWLLPLLSMLFVAVMVGIQGLYVRIYSITIITYFLACILAVLFFGPSLIYISLSVFLFFILHIAFYAMLDEKRALVSIRIRKITKMGIPLTLTGIIIFTAGLYYKNLTLKAEKDKFIVPSEIIAPFEKPILNIASSMTPGYKEDLTVREHLAFTISSEVSKDPEILRIFPDVFSSFTNDYDPTPANIEKLIKEDKEFREVLTNKINESKPTWSFGKPLEEEDIKSDLLVSDFILKTFKEKINETITPYQNSLPLFFTILFFFTLKIISFFIALLAYILEFVIFQIFKVTKIIRITHKTVEKELIEI